MEQEPSQEETTIQQSTGRIDSKIVLIFITLVLFIVALYFEYRSSDKPENYNEVIIGQPEPVIQQPKPQAPSRNILQAPPSLAKQFYQATARGDLSSIKAMISQLQPNEINAITSGMTPIMKASSLGKENIVML